MTPLLSPSFIIAMVCLVAAVWIFINHCRDSKKRFDGYSDDERAILNCLYIRRLVIGGDDDYERSVIDMLAMSRAYDKAAKDEAV
jgi:hypothetical protein